MHRFRRPEGAPQLRRRARGVSAASVVIGVAAVSPVVYLVRHGHTELNAAGSRRGRLDPLLDEVGRREATELAALLVLSDPSRVVTSPRARRTGEAAAEMAGLTVEVDDALDDRDYGLWAGGPAGALAAYRNGDAPGVEPFDAFRDRVIRGFVRLAAQSSGVLVVMAHDAVNQVVLRSVVGDGAAIEQPTGCWNRLERTLVGWAAPVIGAVAGDGQRI